LHACKSREREREGTELRDTGRLAEEGTKYRDISHGWLRVRVREIVYWEREIVRGGFLERYFERVGTTRWCGSSKGMPDSGAVRQSQRERE
jgi:hypothetical protein